MFRGKLDEIEIAEDYDLELLPGIDAKRQRGRRRGDAAWIGMDRIKEQCCRLRLRFPAEEAEEIACFPAGRSVSHEDLEVILDDRHFHRAFIVAEAGFASHGPDAYRQFAGLRRPGTPMQFYKSFHTGAIKLQLLRVEHPLAVEEFDHRAFAVAKGSRDARIPRYLIAGEDRLGSIRSKEIDIAACFIISEGNDQQRRRRERFWNAKRLAGVVNTIGGKHCKIQPAIARTPA